MKQLKKILWYIKITCFSLLETLTNILPEGSYGDRVRGKILGIQIKKCGKKLKVSKNVKILNPQNLVIGNNVYLGYGSWINAKYSVEIKDNTMLGPYVVISSDNHIFTKEMMSFYGNITGERIEIGEGTWIAAGVIITASTKFIGNYCLIAANSVITKSIPDNSRVIEVNKIIGNVYEE